MCVREGKGHGIVMAKRVLKHTVQDMTDNFLTSVVMVDQTSSKIPIRDKGVSLAKRTCNLSTAMRGEYGLCACGRHDTYITRHITVANVGQLRSLSIC